MPPTVDARDRRNVRIPSARHWSEEKCSDALLTTRRPASVFGEYRLSVV